jgi:hypothetical protein
LVARSWIVDEILVANGVRLHVARKVAVSGAKADPGMSGFELCEKDAHGLLESGEFYVCCMVSKELPDEDGEEAAKNSGEEENDPEDWCRAASREIASREICSSEIVSHE